MYPTIYDSTWHLKEIIANAKAKALREAARGYLHTHPEIHDDLVDLAARAAARSRDHGQSNANPYRSEAKP